MNSMLSTPLMFVFTVSTITGRSLPPGAERPKPFLKLKLQGIEVPARCLPTKGLRWHRAMGLLPVTEKLTRWNWLNWDPCWRRRASGQPPAQQR